MNQPVTSAYVLERIFLQIPIFLKDLEQYLREAIRIAHAAQSITPAQFVEGMLLMGGKGHPDLVMLRTGITLDAGGDPYRHLDLRTCVRYLSCGGLRILSESAGTKQYATDQDAFFDFFRVDYQYATVPERPCGRMLQAGEFSTALLHLYRMIAEEDRTKPFSIFVCQGVSKKLGVLIEALQPLCDTPWPKQSRCIALMRTLAHARLCALDAENGAVHT